MTHSFPTRRSSDLGYLIGEENQGIACMFTMMNNARLVVGVQGVALAERAYQQARAYAFERTQGRLLEGGDGAAKIVQHPDVRRMLEIGRASCRERVCQYV